MDAWYRSLTPTERGGIVLAMWEQGRALQLAGLRARFPDESEEQLELRLAEQWLGAELFARVMAHRKALGLDRQTGAPQEAASASRAPSDQV